MADLKKEILKKLDRFQYSRGRREVFLDAVEHMALTIATKFDPLKQEERSDRIAEIVSNYKGQDGALFFMLQTDMLSLLKDIHQKPGDYLGELYMQIEAGNKNAGQYFTPYDVSKFMAEITLGELPDKPFILNEPCCGSGGMVVAAADVLQSRGYNFTDKMLVVANDIDRHCVLMAYTQLSFAAVPAVVQWQDTLTQEKWDTFYTPAYTLQASKFSRLLHSRETQM